MAANSFVCANRRAQEGRRELQVLIRSVLVVDACPANSTYHSDTSNQVVCILLYDGNGGDVIINYLLLILNFAVCVVQLLYVSKRQSTAQQQERGIHDTPSLRRSAIKATFALLFVVVFQIGLCLAVGCVGISIVWCAMLGWFASDRIFGDRRRRLGQANRQERSEAVPLDAAAAASAASSPAEADADAMSSEPDPDSPSPNARTPPSKEKCLDYMILSASVLDVAAIVYYGVVEPPITTVAHICAIALGSLCWWISALVN